MSFTIICDNCGNQRRLDDDFSGLYEHESVIKDNGKIDVSVEKFSDMDTEIFLNCDECGNSISGD